MKKTLLALILIFTVFTTIPAARAGTTLLLASGLCGGTYNPLGEKIASLVNCNSPELSCVTQHSGGSVDNCRLIGQDKADVGFALGTVLRQALTGEGPFRDPGPLELEVLMKLYPSPEHLVATQRSGIQDISGLKGKTVSLGVPGSGNRLFAEEILREAGLAPGRDLRCVGLKQRQAARAMADGTLDAAFWNFALPGAAVLEVSAFCDVVLVPLPLSITEFMTTQHPGLYPCSIPAGTYPGQEQNIPTFADDNYLIGRTGLAARQTYHLIKTLMDHRDEVTPINPALAAISPENAIPKHLPLNPGAGRYFRELGLLSD